MNRNKAITILLSLSIFLIATAFLTIKSSFAYPDNNSNLWDVHYGEIENVNESIPVNINNGNIDFNMMFTNYGEEHSFIIPIINDGTYDAYLSDISMTKLNKIKVGTGKTGRTYYLSDFLHLSVTYKDIDNKNNLNLNESLKYRDELKTHSSNKVLIKAKLFDKNKINDEALKILEESDFVIKEKNNLTLNINLNVNIKYSEVK